MSNTTRQTYGIRFELQDGKLVTAQMKQLGKDGKESLEEIAKGASRVDDRMGALTQTLLQRLVPAITVGGLIGAARSAVSSLADMDDQAKRLKITAEELQKIRFIGRDVGVDAAAAESAFAGFIAKVAEAQQGMGKLVPIFERYNIELKDASGQNRAWEEILRDVAAAINGTADAQEQMFIAGKLGLQDFLDILAKGPSAFDRLSMAAKQSGSIIDEDIVKAAAEFDKAWKDATENFAARMKSKIVDIMIDIKRLLQAIGVVERSDPLSSIDERIGQLERRRAGGLYKGDKHFANATERMIADLQKERENYLSSPEYASSQIRAGQAQWQKESEQLANYRRFAPKDGKTLAESIEDEKRVRQDSERAVKESIKLAEQEQQKIEDVIDSLRHRNDIVGLSALEQEIYNKVREAGTTLDSEAGQEIERLVRQLDAAERATESLSRASEGMGKSFSSNVEKMIFDGERLSDTLGNLLDDIGRILYRETAGKFIDQAVTGLARDILPGLFDFGGFRAEGGPIQQGKWYIAGERGPEPVWGGGPGAFAVGYGQQQAQPNVAVGFNVNIVNNNPSAAVETRQGGSDGRSLEVVVSEVVGRAVSQGRLDDAMGNRYGLAPRTVNARG